MLNPPELLYEWQQKLAEQSGQVEIPKQVHKRIKILLQGNNTRKSASLNLKAALFIF